MAKSNGCSDRREPVEKLWERYERGEIGADEVIKRLRGHGTYFDAMTDDLSKINPSSIRNITSTATAARYLMKMMVSSGKYDLLKGDELQDFDDVASQTVLGYNKILGSKEYKNAQDGISKLVSEFIGDLPTEVKPVDIMEEPEVPVSEPLAIEQLEPTKPADASKTTDQTAASPQPKGRKPGLLSRIKYKMNQELE